MGVQISLAELAGLLRNDGNGNARFNLPLTITESGFAIVAHESAGSDEPGGRLILRPETTEDCVQRVQTESLHLDFSFNSTSQDTSTWMNRTTTMAIAYAGGFLVTNSGLITTANTGLISQTNQTFPITGDCPLYVTTLAALAVSATTNTTIDFGPCLAPVSNPYAPTDGVYFRVSPAGIEGIACYNGVEVSTGKLAFTHTPNRVYKFTAAITTDEVTFWIDGDYYGRVTRPAGSATTMAAAVPYTVRHAIGNSAASQHQQLRIQRVTISQGQFGQTRDWTDVQCGMGLCGYQGISGGTMGSTANFANSANPSAAVPTNTTAALGSGLGGQFWETDTLAVNTDGIISSYQVPAPTINNNGRKLLVSGVTVDSFVQTALTVGGYNAVWSIAFGHTLVSLATAEAAGAKAPRRVPLGVQTVASGAAALVQLQTVSRTFKNPLPVMPGEFFQVVKKKVGSAPSAGVIAHIITVDSKWD